MMKVPPAVRTDFNWPEEFNGIVSGYPVDAHCMGEGGCDNAVVWRADYHGCQQELLCNAHLEYWLQLVIGRIALYGSVECASCPREFANIDDVVTVIAI